jgi:hypothetical protein
MKIYLIIISIIISSIQAADEKSAITYSNDAKSIYYIMEGGYIEHTCISNNDFNNNQSSEWNWELTTDNLENITLTNNVNNVEIKTDFDPKTNQSNSRLVMRKININMSGKIVCKATNNLTTVSVISQSVTLRVVKQVYTILLYLACVVQVVSICVVILIVEKKPVKKDTENNVVFVAEKF